MGGPETANPSLGGILSRRLHAYDGAGRCHLALGELVLPSNGVRSEDPCNHPGYDSSRDYIMG